MRRPIRRGASLLAVLVLAALVPLATCPERATETAGPVAVAEPAAPAAPTMARAPAASATTQRVPLVPAEQDPPQARSTADPAATATLRGRVLRNDLPLAGWPVSYQDGHGETRTVTGAAGRFELAALRPGRGLVRVASPAPAAAAAAEEIQVLHPVELRPGAAQEIVFAWRTGVLAGALDPGGESLPAEPVQVRLDPLDDPLLPWVTTFTGAGGVFRFTAAPAGRWRVSAHAPGFTTAVATPVDVPPGGAAPWVTLPLRRPVRVAGRLRLPAEDAADFVSIVLHDAGGRGDVAAAEWDCRTGTFAVAGVAPGTYDVLIATRRVYAPLRLEVPVGGLSDVVLAPRPAPAAPGGG